MIRPIHAIQIFLIVAVITLVGNWVGMQQINPVDAALGMLILVAMVMAGWWLARVLPVPFPPIVFVSLLGILLTMPWTPGSEWIVSHTTQVNFLATTTPVLAFAGISIGKDLDKFAELGWRIIVVALVVFTGTFLGSAVIAQAMLRLTGQI